MTDEKDDKDEKPQIDLDREPDEPDEPDDGDEPVDGRVEEVPERRRLDEETKRKRISGAGVLIGVLLALLGFAFVVQIRSNATDNSYAALRESDLLQILSDLDASERRISQDISSLQQTKQELQSGAASRDAALEEAKTRADELGILAGTLKAQGAGIILQFVENTGTIKAGTLLNAVQELRGAGAEALQIDGTGGSVRIIASTSFVDADGGVRVDGRRLTGPYTIRAIGDPATMRPAVEIHGGVVAGVTRDGGNVIVNQRDVVEINETRPPPELQYAQPVR
jgi:uncharacterized protein YlxW (UPF0749 family)